MSTHRFLSVRFSEAAYQRLGVVADSFGVTKSDLVRAWMQYVTIRYVEHFASLLVDAPESSTTTKRSSRKRARRQSNNTRKAK